MEKSRRSKFYSTGETTTAEFKRSKIKRHPKTDIVIVSVQYTPTVDSSLSTTRVRQRLCDLMGTDVIRLNDKLYFQKLSQRLQEEYETTMDKQEEARAASEKERLRRLMLEGVIDAPNDYRAVLHGHGQQNKKKKKKRKIKRNVSAPIPDTSKASDDEGQSKTRKEDVVTQVEILSSSRQSSAKSPDTSSKEPENRKHLPKKVSIEENENTSKKINEMHARPPHHEAALRTSSAGSTSRKSRRIKSAAPRLSHWEKDRSSSDDGEVTDDTDYDTQSLPDRHYVRKPSKYSRQEPERVSKLRGAETVEGLYSIAEELVCPLGADDQPSRKGKKAY